MLREKRNIKPWLILLLFVAALGVAAALSLDALRGTKLGRMVGLSEPAGTREVYYCPMHPYYKSDKPGTARSATCGW